MVIALLGDNCVGKSTVAAILQQELHAQMFTGKDYLRLAKNADSARALFQKRLEEAVTGETVLYLISEKEQIPLLPQGSRRFLLTASLERIKERFAARLHGNLPPPVAAMLERNYGQFEQKEWECRLDMEALTAQEAAQYILQQLAD